MSPATKSTRSAYWFVRVDGPKDYLTSQCKTLVEKIDVISCLAAFHVGDKKEHPHLHMVVQLNSSPQKQSFAVRIKELFNIEKRSQYALDVWDGQRGAGACSYLFHEESAEILVNKGFSEDDIAVARAANDAVQRVVAINKDKASNKFVDKALSYFVDKTPMKYDILHYLMKLCKDGECYWPGSFRAKQLVEEVQIKLSGTGIEFDCLVQEFYNKMF